MAVKKWNRNFHLGKRTSFSYVPVLQEIIFATQKVVFHSLSHWIVWKPFVNTVKLCLVYNGPVYSGHSIPITVTGQLPENFQLPYIICKVDLYIAVTLHLTVTL